MTKIQMKAVKIMSIVLIIAGIGLMIVCSVIRENGKGHQTYIMHGDKIISQGVMGGMSSDAQKALNEFSNLGKISIAVGLIVFVVTMVKDAKYKKQIEVTKKEEFAERTAYAEVVMSKPDGANQEIFFRLQDGTMIHLLNRTQISLEAGNRGNLIWSGKDMVSFEEIR